MKKNIMLTVLVVTGFGCQTFPLARDVRSTQEVPIADGIPAPQSGADEKAGLQVVGFTSLGSVVLFDGQTGEITSAVEGGGGTPRDVAMDPWRNGVWVFEDNEDASGGEIRFCPLEKQFGMANALRPCEHAVWIDGVAAILPTENGLWIFEDGIGGARWKVLRIGEAIPSTSAPRPVSIRMQHNEIEAFSFGFQNDRLQLLTADMEPTGPVVSTEFDWGAPFGYPPTARYAWFGPDAGLLFDAVSNTLTIRRVVGGAMGEPATMDVGIAVPRIEAAEAIGNSALVLGEDALWVVTARDFDVELVSGLWLHGDVRDSPLFFSRDLLVVPDRAFVGTNRGVRAIGLQTEAEEVVNAFLDDDFVGEGLRGPLDVVRRAEP